MSTPPNTRSLRVPLIAGMFFPLLTMLAVLALDTQQALRFVIVGCGVMALLTAGAAYRQPVGPGRGGSRGADGRSAPTREID